MRIEANDLLLTQKPQNSQFCVRRRAHWSRKTRPRLLLAAVAAFCLLSLRLATAQEADAVAPTPSQARKPVESELVVEGMGSVGHVKIFANSWWSNIPAAGGVEYDRHCWGHLLNARMDYVAEVLPLLLLNEPAHTSLFGTKMGPARKTVPGIGVEPIGVRMMWRSKRDVKPYLIFKGGMFVFTQKVLSQYSSYQDFSLQFGAGTQFRLTPRLDMRAGASWIHFSNAFMVPSNPGLDVMSLNAGLSYHLGKPRQ